MSIFRDIRLQLRSNPARDLAQPLSKEQILAVLKSEPDKPTRPSPFANLAAIILHEKTDGDSKKK